MKSFKIVLILFALLSSPAVKAVVTDSDELCTYLRDRAEEIDHQKAKSELKELRNEILKINPAMRKAVKEKKTFDQFRSENSKLKIPDSYKMYYLMQYKSTYCGKSHTEATAETAVNGKHSPLKSTKFEHQPSLSEHKSYYDEYLKSVKKGVK